MSGFHYIQEQNGTDLQVQIDGNFGIQNIDGIVKVETPSTITVSQEGTYTAGSVKTTGDTTIDTATFISNGSVEFQSDHIDPSSWIIEGWQDQW